MIVLEFIGAILRYGYLRFIKKKDISFKEVDDDYIINSFLGIFITVIFIIFIFVL